MENWRRRQRRGAKSAAPLEGAPFALTVEGRHGPVLHALDPAARGASLRIGQRVTDARAICPELAIEPCDEAADAGAMSELAVWATRWSPLTACDRTSGLFLDMSGGAHLWGGEEALVDNIEEGMAGLGLSARIAIAPTPGAAWALARYGSDRVVRPDVLEAILTPLPVASLRLSEETLVLLGRLGLKRVGDLIAVPRLALARRFTGAEPAENPLIRLDQALGRCEEPLLAEPFDPPPRVLRRVTDPIVDVPFLDSLLEAICSDLALALEERGVGLRGLVLTLYRVDGQAPCIAVETSRATREPAHLHRLFQGRLDSLDSGFGFDAAALQAVRVERLDPGQADMLRGDESADGLARLLDRLAAKLGRASVCRPHAHGSHVPERSLHWRPAIDGAGTGMQAKSPRPVRLLDRPEPIAVVYETPEGEPRHFTWRKARHRVVRVDGPERIAPEWWRERSSARARDYYRVEDESGRRYWLFRDGRFGDGHDPAPLWYLHGLFA